MYLRHPLLLGVAIGLTIAFAVLMTVVVESGSLSSDVIISGVTGAMFAAWITWGAGCKSSVNRGSRKDIDAETIVRNIRS
jgi:hypothetical protein